MGGAAQGAGLCQTFRARRGEFKAFKLSDNFAFDPNRSIGFNLGCLDEVDLSTLEPKLLDGAQLL